MRTCIKSAPNRISLLLSVNFRVLIWVVIILSLLLFLSIAFMHFKQKKVIENTLLHLENFRQARIDLAKGFLFICLDNDSSSPYSSSQGLALINQSINSFKKSSNFINSKLPTDINSASRAELVFNFNKNLETLRSLLKEGIESKNYTSELKTKLKIAFASLESKAEDIDYSIQSSLIIFFKKHDHFFHSTMLFVALILAIISGIVIFAGRVQKQSESALKESEQRWQFALEGAGDGVWDLNLQSNKMYYSPKWKEMLGYSDNEITCFLNEWKQKIHPGDYKIVKEELRDLLAGNSRVLDSEHRLLCKNGQYKWIHATGKVMVLSNEGKPQRIIGTQRDITKRKQTEEEIIKLNNELEQRVRKRTEELQNAVKELEGFSYSVSHDLRAPLRAINGFLNILEEDHFENIDEEGKRLMKIIENNSRKMGQLIDDLLAFSRIGRADLQKVKIDMNPLIESIYKDFTNPILQETYTFIVNQLPKVEVDPVLMHQAWANLISNAIKFTSKMENPTIEIGYTENENFYEFYIKDNGVGFEMEYANKLFGVFERLHSYKEYEGTGVGLAITNRIIARHGGKIWAKSEIDKGATFYFSIPKSSV